MTPPSQRSYNVQVWTDARRFAGLVRWFSEQNIGVDIRTASRFGAMLFDLMEKILQERGMAPFATHEEALAYLRDRGLSTRQLTKTDRLSPLAKTLTLEERHISATITNDQVRITQPELPLTFDEVIAKAQPAPEPQEGDTDAPHHD